MLTARPSIAQNCQLLRKHIANIIIKSHFQVHFVNSVTRCKIWFLYLLSSTSSGKVQFLKIQLWNYHKKLNFYIKFFPSVPCLYQVSQINPLFKETDGSVLQNWKFLS